MDSQEIVHSGGRVRSALEELEWRMDWVILEPTAVAASELRHVAVEIRLASMCHAAVLTELMASLDHVVGPDAAAAVGASLKSVFDGLVHLRLQVDRFEMTGHAEGLLTAYQQLSESAEALFDVEGRLCAAYSPLLFPAESGS